MAGTGGYRPGSGRPKGSANKVTIKAQERIIASGIAPLDVLISAMRYYYERAQKMIEKALAEQPDGAPIDTKELAAAIDHCFDKASDHAAKAAAYVHPRMSPMDYNSLFDPTRLTDDERRTLTRLLAKGLGIEDPPVAIEHVRDTTQH